jgi:citrate synthase
MPRPTAYAGSPHRSWHRELALVLLGIAMGLPKNTSGALFTLSRTAGWVAHVREQRLAGTLLRPRAKFIGEV